MAHLSGVRVAVLAMNGFEESELIDPIKNLLENGAQVDLISEKRGQILGFRHFEKGLKIPVDFSLDEVNSDEYQALILPGGALNADYERAVPKALEFVRGFEKMGKPIAAICHAPWVLISAGLVRGRTLTSYHTLKDDIKNAGGHWTDQEVTRDQNWITSREPRDLPAFNHEIINAIEEFLKTGQLGFRPTVPQQEESYIKHTAGGEMPEVPDRKNQTTSHLLEEKQAEKKAG